MTFPSICMGSYKELPVHYDKLLCIYDDTVSIDFECAYSYKIGSLEMDRSIKTLIDDILSLGFKVIACIGSIYACNLGKIIKLIASNETVHELLPFSTPKTTLRRRSNVRIISIPFINPISCIDNIARIIIHGRPYFYRHKTLFPDLILIDKANVHRDFYLELEAYIKDLNIKTNLMKPKISMFELISGILLQHDPSIIYVISETLRVFLGRNIGENYLNLATMIKSKYIENKYLFSKKGNEGMSDENINRILHYVYRHPYTYSNITYLLAPDIVTSILDKLINLNFIRRNRGR